ncbi:hypothetical protein [Spirosoma areae]
MWSKLYEQILAFPIDFISHIGSLIPLLVGLSVYRYVKLELKIGIVLFALYFIKDTYALWLSLQSFNNLFTQNIQASFEVLLIGAIYRLSFQTNFLRSALLALTILSFLATLLFYQSNATSAQSQSVVKLFSILICLVYFNNLLAKLRVKNILLFSMFWVNAGLLIYSAGTFFIFLSAAYIYDMNSTSEDTFDLYWNISQILFLVFCLFFTVGLWVSKYDRENLL